MPKQIENEIYDDKTILDKHLSKYLDGVNKTIFLAELTILLGTSLVAVLILTDFYPYKMNINIFHVPVKVYIVEQVIHKLLAWVIIAFYFFKYKKASLEKRKNMLCSLSITLSSLLAFGCWNETYFGFFFITPILIAIPLSKNTQKRMFIICLILSIIYALFQAYIRRDKYLIIIGILTVTSVIIYYIISIRLHKTMYNALLDVKEYSSISKKLYEEVAHDHLTNALSVSALHKEVENIDKLSKSLAFLDLDNFKGINDKYGHDMGDNILKLLVDVVQMNDEIIYRYGGDEFVIISNNSATSLAKKLEKVKLQFSDAATDKYNIKASMSIGVINIVGKEKLYEYLKQCDRLMYISKEKGKNQITVEAD